MILLVVYFSTWLLIPWILLKRSVHPSASVAWIMAVIFIPFLGPLLCALIGVTRWERRTPQKQLASAIIDSLTPDVQDEFLAPEPEMGAWSSLGRMTTELVGAKVTAGNKIQILPDTKRSAKLIEQIVDEAQEWVHVEFYIWNRDKFGTRLRDLLVSKAKQGVEVRLLYDGIGSMWINREFLKPLRAAGVSTAPFNPGHRLTSLLTLNLRNHRKLVISDGRVGLTGGMNIGDEYIRPTVGYGHWRDTQIRLSGPAVLQFQKVFARDWYYATGEALTDAKYYPRPTTPGDVPAAVVADGPDDEVDAFYTMFVAAIGMARERVTLATPYFVPPEGLAVALEAAAWRGVRVRMIVANRGNFLWTLKAGQSYYQSLLQAGVEIYEYQRGIYHAKTLTIDGKWSMVGTPNCDFRSFVLNFEIAVSMFDEDAAKQLEDEFESDLKYAQRIDWEAWRARRRTTKLHERFWRLFAPLF
ncbi:cardiolipin synthase [Candidatus Laterigemmans baculatus]|uniref:cardiolipin synthase n=1 Tax=Candidatus Laterigemmans baculatus TaxID=2770505 RepID=UPI00194006D9|nr:cardiolipin synthase [Candidatus Laterigemmans baculatus]